MLKRAYFRLTNQKSSSIITRLFGSISNRRDALNDKELKALRKKLEEFRERISHGLNTLENETLNKSQRDASGDLSGYSFHMADVATDNYDLEFNLDLASSEQQVLNDIDEALRKMDENTYGVCEGCNKKIKIGRLKVVPHARNCIECQTKQEKEQGFNK